MIWLLFIYLALTLGQLTTVAQQSHAGECFSRNPYVVCEPENQLSKQQGNVVHRTAD